MYYPDQKLLLISFFLYLVQEEMKNNMVFAKYAFQIQSGQKTVDELIEKKLIQNVY